MKRPKRIIVAGNGPSAYSKGARKWAKANGPTWYGRIFRTNYFYLTDGDPLNYEVTDWFICEDANDCRAVRALYRFTDKRPTIWLPGLDERKVEAIETNHLLGIPIRLQRNFASLPAGCRWDRDLRPERPLMGSYAIAVAVAMQPEELFLCGHDLFRHPSKTTHAGAPGETRDWQTAFNKEYLENTHRNHRLTGDVKYIGAALQAYKGKLTSVGSVLAGYFRDKYAHWNWIEG